MKTVTLQIEGMSCHGCVSKVTAALEQVAGTADVSVSLQDARAVVRTDPQRVAVNDLLGAVRRAGFNISGFNRS